MPTPDEVPEADRLEQEMPPWRAERDQHLRPDAATADILEQERPLVEDDEPRGLDAERTEPVSDDDWTPTGSSR